ncbi:MAG: adenosylcobinamide-GDP ribazoletransferase [Bacillota bacterium]|jgi:adenosylcobinamide-GDP ribazoletransferase|nr:adenosylcobinamide-GDP ribazoletransferase [Clostridia bacterium]
MFRSIVIAITFLSRIPLKINFTYDEKDMARTSRYFPLVGLMIGLSVAIALFAFGWINQQLGAVAAILTGVILTGGLHFDGFLDTVDGIFSARDREKMLEIMKDSRVGAHGVTAAISFFLLKFVSYQMVLESLKTFWVIPMAFIISRWILVFAILYFPGARKQGLGQIFIKHRRRWDFPLATFFVICPILVLNQWLTLIPLGLTILICWLVCRSLVKILGGLTGDTYGALAEISETLFILIFLVCEALYPLIQNIIL